jgi:hypothetical protein
MVCGVRCMVHVCDMVLVRRVVYGASFTRFSTQWREAWALKNIREGSLNPAAAAIPSPASAQATVPRSSQGFRPSANRRAFSRQQAAKGRAEATIAAKALRAKRRSATMHTKHTRRPQTADQYVLPSSQWYHACGLRIWLNMIPCVRPAKLVEHDTMRAACEVG